MINSNDKIDGTLTTKSNNPVQKERYLIKDNVVVGIAKNNRSKIAYVPSNIKIAPDAFNNKRLDKICIGDNSTNIDKEWLQNGTISDYTRFEISAKWVYENIEDYRDIKFSSDLDGAVWTDKKIKDIYIDTYIEFLTKIANTDYECAFIMIGLDSSDKRNYSQKVILRIFNKLNNSSLSDEISIENLLKVNIDEEFEGFLKDAIPYFYSHFKKIKKKTIKTTNGKNIPVKYLYYVMILLYSFNFGYSYYNFEKYIGYMDLFDTKDIQKFIRYESPDPYYFEKEDIDTTEVKVLYRYCDLDTVLVMEKDFIEWLKWFGDDGYIPLEVFYYKFLSILNNSKDLYILSSIYALDQLNNNKTDSFLDDVKDINDVLDVNGEFIYNEYKIKLQNNFTLKTYDSLNNEIKLEKDIFLTKLFLLVNNRKKCLENMVNYNYKIKFNTFKKLYLNKKCYMNIVKNIVFGIYEADKLVNTFIINDVDNYTDVNGELIDVRDDDYISFVDASELIDFDNKDRSNLDKWKNIFDKKQLTEYYSQFNYIELEKLNYPTINEYLQKYMMKFITYDDAIYNFHFKKYDFIVSLKLCLCFGELVICTRDNKNDWYIYYSCFLDSLTYDNEKEYPRRQVNRDILLIDRIFSDEKNTSIRTNPKYEYLIECLY